jgi:hypothetical protein
LQLQLPRREAALLHCEHDRASLAARAWLREPGRASPTAGPRRSWHRYTIKPLVTNKDTIEHG